MRTSETIEVISSHVNSLPAHTNIGCNDVLNAERREFSGQTGSSLYVPHYARLHDGSVIFRATDGPLDTEAQWLLMPDSAEPMYLRDPLITDEGSEPYTQPLRLDGVLAIGGSLEAHRYLTDILGVITMEACRGYPHAILPAQSLSGR